MESLQATLYGDVENFVEPILIDSLLLQVHIDLFMTLFAILILSSIYIRLYSDEAETKWIVHLLFILGMLAPIMLILAYFVGTFFAAMWLISFILWDVLASIVGMMILKNFWSNEKSNTLHHPHKIYAHLCGFKFREWFVAFLLSQGLESSESVMHTIKNFITTPADNSLEGLIEVVTPHLFAMGTLILS